MKKIITTLLKLAPDSPDVHQLQADYYLLRGEPQKTIAIWQDFTQAHPHNHQGWHYYAQFLSKVDEHKQAGVNF